MKEFSLRECYILSCYGLKAVINDGKLEEFTREEEDAVQENIPEGMSGVRDAV